jgi:hypothetical protein
MNDNIADDKKRDNDERPHNDEDEFQEDQVLFALHHGSNKEGEPLK